MIALRLFIAQWGDALEVDLLQMGIDLPRDLGTRRLPWSRLRRIIEHLGENSAVARARRNGEPDLFFHWMRRIDYQLRVLSYMWTEEAKTGKNAPEPVELPSQRKARVEKGRRAQATLEDRHARRARELAAGRLEGTP